MLDRAPGQDHGRPASASCPRPISRRPCRPTATTRRSTASSTRWSASTRGWPKNGGTIAGQKIRDLVTVNGVRVTLEDGTWGLVRASSNKPELVIVGREPGVGSQQGRHLPRYRSAPRQASPRSASTIRRSEAAWGGGRRGYVFGELTSGRFSMSFAHCSPRWAQRNLRCNIDARSARPLARAQRASPHLGRRGPEAVRRFNRAAPPRALPRLSDPRSSLRSPVFPPGVRCRPRVDVRHRSCPSPSFA